MEEQEVNEIRSDLDQLEEQGDKMDKRTDEVDEQIDETRDEVEAKKSSSEVPGLQEPIDETESGMSVNAQEPGGTDEEKDSADPGDDAREGDEDEAQQAD